MGHERQTPRRFAIPSAADPFRRLNRSSSWGQAKPRCRMRRDPRRTVDERYPWRVGPRTDGPGGGAAGSAVWARWLLIRTEFPGRELALAFLPSSDDEMERQEQDGARGCQADGFASKEARSARRDGGGHVAMRAAGHAS